jgi:hypothetical protein
MRTSLVQRREVLNTGDELSGEELARLSVEGLHEDGKTD